MPAEKNTHAVFRKRWRWVFERILKEHSNNFDCVMKREGLGSKGTIVERNASDYMEDYAKKAEKESIEKRTPEDETLNTVKPLKTDIP